MHGIRNRLQSAPTCLLPALVQPPLHGSLTQALHSWQVAAQRSGAEGRHEVPPHGLVLPRLCRHQRAGAHHLLEGLGEGRCRQGAAAEAGRQPSARGQLSCTLSGGMNEVIGRAAALLAFCR